MRVFQRTDSATNLRRKAFDSCKLFVYIWLGAPSLYTAEGLPSPRLRVPCTLTSEPVHATERDRYGTEMLCVCTYCFSGVLYLRHFAAYSSSLSHCHQKSWPQRPSESDAYFVISFHLVLSRVECLDYRLLSFFPTAEPSSNPSAARTNLVAASGVACWNERLTLLNVFCANRLPRPDASLALTCDQKLK